MAVRWVVWDYSAAYPTMFGVPSSPYASFDYSSQLLMSPTGYGFSTAADLLSPTYSSYPFSVVDPYTGSSFYYTVNAPASPMAAAPSTPAALGSPAAYSAFSFPSLNTASIPYPTTPTHASIPFPTTPTNASIQQDSHTSNSRSHSPTSANSSLFPSHLSLFLCHLPLHWSEANLLSLCNPFGHLTSARIVRDRDGNSRGYGFVAFARADEAGRAREALDGRKVDGRLVKVQWKDGRVSRTSAGGAAAGGAESMNVEGAVYGGLLSPTSAAMMGLAVMA